MSSIRFEGLNFYERTLETIFSNIDLFEGNELKILFIINKLTVGSGLNAVEIKLDDLGRLTGLSRKTLINGINRLKSLHLITRSEKSKPYRYGINRDQLQRMSLDEKENEVYMRKIVSRHKLMEELHFAGLDLPPQSKKIFDVWNKHFHKRLNITDESHVKCIKTTLNRVSVDTLYHIVVDYTTSTDNKNYFQTDEGLEMSFSQIEGEQI